MKLLTLNYHAWREDNQLEKIEALAKAIQENSYDVIALQEVSQSMDGQVKNHRDERVMISVEELVPQDHFLRAVEATIDFDVIEEGGPATLPSR